MRLLPKARDRHCRVEAVFLNRQVSQFLNDCFNPEKLNVACIRNVVRQMHIHLVARSGDDAAWPDTVRGSDFKMPDEAEDVITICVKVRLAWGSVRKLEGALYRP